MTTNTPNRYNPGNFVLHTIANPSDVNNISPGRPVWKVTMPPDHVVIVKAELVGNRNRDAAMVSAAFGVHLMAAVTPGMEAVKLSQNELRALWDVNATHCKPQGNDHGTAAKAYITNVLKTGVDAFITFKMPFVSNLFKLDDAIEQHKAGEFAQHLAADDYAATVELGKIIAVDLFIGNDDRFDDKGALINTGNVLLYKDGQNKWHAIGLDHYAAQGEHSNLSQNPRQDWSGPKLNTPNQLLNYAGKVMTSLNATGQGRPALGLQPKFQEKLAQGLAQGAAMIRSTVQQSDPLTIPDGVKARFQTLHWDLRAPNNNNNNNNNTNPVQIVNQVMGGNHPPPQNNTNTGGRQSPNLQQSGGRQSPNLQQSGGRQSPNQPPPNTNTGGGRQSPNPQQSGGRQSPSNVPPQGLRRNSNNK